MVCMAYIRRLYRWLTHKTYFGELRRWLSGKRTCKLVYRPEFKFQKLIENPGWRSQCVCGEMGDTQENSLNQKGGLPGMHSTAAKEQRDPSETRWKVRINTQRCPETSVCAPDTHTHTHLIGGEKEKWEIKPNVHNRIWMGGVQISLCNSFNIVHFNVCTTNVGNCPKTGVARKQDREEDEANNIKTEWSEEQEQKGRSWRSRKSN